MHRSLARPRAMTRGSSAASRRRSHRLLPSPSPPPPNSPSPNPAAAASAGSHAAPSRTARSHRRSRGCGRRDRQSVRHKSAPSAAWWRGGSACAAARSGYWSRPCAEIGHQRERAVVAHHDAIDVGDRQRKARALQQRADIAQIGKRRDARRHPALAFGFRRGKGLPSSVSVSPPIIAASNSPSGLQRAADLRQHARQIVDELERERGDDEIERFRLQAAAFRDSNRDRCG